MSESVRDLCVLGHNEFLLGLAEHSDIKESLECLLLEYRPSKLYLGLDAGPSIWASQIAWNMNIPYYALIPYRSFPNLYGVEFVKEYEPAINRALAVQIMSESSSQTLHKLKRRDEGLIDRSSICIIVWDHRQDSTEKAIDYAKKLKRRIHYLDPTKSVHENLRSYQIY